MIKHSNTHQVHKSDVDQRCQAQKVGIATFLSREVQKPSCSVGLDTGTVAALGGAVLVGRKEASGAVGTVLFLKLGTGCMECSFG